MRFQSILKLALVLAVCLSLSAQGAQRLYLVTAVPTPYGPPVQSVLWSVENNKLVQVAELTKASAGSDFVAVDHDRRLLLLGTPHQDPKEILVVNMDAPSSLKTLPVGVPSYALKTGLFANSPKGLLFTAEVLDATRAGQNKLLGIDLSSGAAADLPWNALTGIRRDGWWAPGDGFNGNFQVNLKDGKLMAHAGNTDFDLGIAPPKNLAPEGGSFSLIVSTDAMMVLDRISVRGKGPPAAQGRTQLEIYDRMTQSWSSENFNGGASSVRALNEWLAVNEADVKRDLSGPIVEKKANERQSAGADQRRKVVNPQAHSREQMTVDDLFREDAGVFDGSVELVNIRSGKHYRLNTGQGDTEVLLIDGTTLYYRVNASLFRAQLGRNSIDNPVEILRDANLQLAHWAFLGQ